MDLEFSISSRLEKFSAAVFPGIRLNFSLFRFSPPLMGNNHWGVLVIFRHFRLLPITANEDALHCSNICHRRNIIPSHGYNFKPHKKYNSKASSPFLRCLFSFLFLSDSVLKKSQNVNKDLSHHQINIWICF